MSDISASRSIAGPVILRIQTGKIINLVVLISDAEAIELCNQLRRILEDPTLREPAGENIVVGDFGR